MKSIQRKIILIFFFVLGSGFSAALFAQTADKLEALLENPAVTWAEATVFVLEASDAVSRHMALESLPFGTEPEGAYTAVYDNPAEAFNFAMEQKWLPKKARPLDTAQLNGIALLLIRAFDQKGGIFFSLFKNPHYAYHELVQMEIIRGETDPGMTVSGEELLLMIGRMLTIVEEQETVQ